MKPVYGHGERRGRVTMMSIVVPGGSESRALSGDGHGRVGSVGRSGVDDRGQVQTLGYLKVETHFGLNIGGID